MSKNDELNAAQMALERDEYYEQRIAELEAALAHAEMIAANS